MDEFVNNENGLNKMEKKEHIYSVIFDEIPDTYRKESWLEEFDTDEDILEEREVE